MLPVGEEPQILVEYCSLQCTGILVPHSCQDFGLEVQRIMLYFLKQSVHEDTTAINLQDQNILKK